MATKQLLKNLCCCLCLLATTFSYGQNNTVSGKVTDESNNPLPGATILLKNGKTGVQTDASGSFTVSLPAGVNSFTVSNVGFEPQTVAINGRSAIIIALKRSQDYMDEVVVIGYGTQRRKDVTGAIGSVKGDAIKNLPVTNVADALQGRIAGVDVIKATGEPGAPSQITIRGVSSLNQPQPLYIIDGIRGSGDNINVQDIATIDVLKDASAAAIYGAAAAGGVIIITTKRGQGTKPTINFSARYGITKPRVLALLNKADFIKAKKLVMDNYYSTNTQTDTLGNSDWSDALFRNGTEANYNLSVSGSSPMVTYFASGVYNKQKGVYIYNGSTLAGGRVNTDIKISNRIKIGEQVNVWQRNTQPVGTAPINPPFRSVPTMNIYSATGFGTNPPGFNGPNLIAQITTADRNFKQLNLQGNVYGEVRLPFDLTFRATFGYTYYAEENNYFQNAFNATVDAIKTRNLTKSFVSNRQILNAYTLAFDRSFHKHSINALAGFEQYSYLYNALYTNETDVGGSNYAYISTSGSTLNIGNGGYDPNGLVKSFFGRIGYDYNKKYYFTANIRRDADFTKFGKGNQFGVFPSASVGWRISEEDFLKKALPGLSLLKLRASYGSLGNSNIGAYRFLSTYDAINAQNFTPGGPVTLNYTQNTLSNDNIKWETVVETNVGIDAEWMSGKMFLSVDWYNKKTKEMLYSLPIPLSNGINEPFTSNIGSVRNKGIDILLGYKNHVKDFNYSVSVTGSFNKNKVLDLDGINSNPIKNGDNNYGNPTQGSLLNQPLTYTLAGLPFGQFYGFRVEGIYSSEAQIDAHPQQGSAAAPKRAHVGDLIYADVNGDGFITDDDRTVIGNPYPKLTYGASINFSWKGLDVAMLFNGVSGVDIFNGIRPYSETLWSDGNTTSQIFGASFFNGNGLTSQPAIGYYNTAGTTFTPEDNGNYTKASSYFVENGSYLKLKNLQLGYSFSNKLLDKAKIKACRLYVMANNVFTITKYSGIDPELGSQYINVNGGTTSRGIDGPYKYPNARIYSIGADLTF
jgi:TonB-linked SusC/RagA family outer membrane protein